MCHEGAEVSVDGVGAGLPPFISAQEFPTEACLGAFPEQAWLCPDL
jgi:hypothetical protein